MVYTGTFHFISFCLITHCSFISVNWRFVATLHWVNLSMLFSSLCASAHFVSLSHILVILKILQTFSSLYLLWWPMISDHWCYYYHSWKAQRTVSIFLAIKYFLSKLCTFLDIIATTHFNISVTYICTVRQKIHVNHFMEILALVQWSGTKATMSPKSAHIYCIPML